MTTTYQVRVVGHIWMPDTQAAYELTVSDLMEYPQSAAESDAEYRVRMVQCAADQKLGDFQGVDAWEIEAVTVEGTRERTVTTREMLVTFSDDDEMAFYDAMYGADDE